MMTNNKLTPWRIWLGCTALLLAWTTTPTVAASDPTAPLSAEQAAVMQKQIQQLDELDEVKVRAQVTVNMLEYAENVFFRLYNQVEKDDAYRISCDDARLRADSIVMTRICVPGFFSQYLPIPAPDFSRSSCGGGFSSARFGNYTIVTDGFSECGSWAGYEPPSIELILMERGEKWRRHMTRTVNSDPRLAAMANRLGHLQYQMVELRNRSMQIKRDKRAALRAARGNVPRVNTHPRTL